MGAWVRVTSCMREVCENCEQNVDLVSRVGVDVPVPQSFQETAEVMNLFTQEHVQQLTDEYTVDDPVPQILEDTE